MRKFRNILTKYNGRTYHSKKEAKYAQTLDILKKDQITAERVAFWFPQVPFVFRCGSKMIVDFIVCFADGRWEIHEVKGGKITQTPLYKLKKRMLKEEYGFDIKEI